MLTESRRDGSVLIRPIGDGSGFLLALMEGGVDNT